MSNVTMAIDETILKKAKKIAVEHNTTLSALVRSYLEKLAAREDDNKERVIKELQDYFLRKDVVVGPKSWKREDLHER